MKNLLKTAAALALAAVCSGCMWGRVRVNDPSIDDRGILRNQTIRSAMHDEPEWSLDPN